MFDHVGKDPDHESGKRRAVSLFLTIVLIGGGTGITAAVAYYTATEVIPEIMEDVELVELIEIEDEPIEDAPPPPPPPPPAAPDEEIDEDAEEEPEPDEMQEEVQELDEKVEDKVATDKGRPPGNPDGVVGGEIGGVEGGVVGGTGNVRVMHHSEVEVKKRVDPKYPKAAKDANLGDQRCLVKVKIDETGTPYDVQVERCPKVFHAATQESIMKWRWYPPKVGKEKVKAQITIGVTYKVR